MLAVGLTGGIGSGKSVVADMFSQLGVPVVDADVIAHQLVRRGADALDEIASVFGDEVIDADGTLDRSRLADIVFNHPEMRERLEAIIHPRVRERIRDYNAEYSTEPYIIVVIPLLLESGQRDLVDRVLVVNASEAIRIERVQARDTRTVAQIRAIMKNQADDRQRQAAADDNLDNNGSLDDLSDEVHKLHQHYIALAAGDNFM